MNEKQSGTMHFTIGEDFGKMLMNLAQEDLLYSLSPSKAINTLTSSLPGLSEQMAIQIIKGDMILTVDADSQQVIASERTTMDQDYPSIDILAWYVRKKREMRKQGKELKNSLDNALYTIRREKDIDVAIGYDRILKYIAGDKEGAFEDLLENLENVDRLSTLVRVTKGYIETSLKIQAVMDWMRKVYPLVFEGDNLYVPDYKEYGNMLPVVMDKFRQFYNMDFSQIEESEQDVIEYINNAQEIDRVIEKGIEPVNIMDNWSAGWLSPEGDYYALNGQIANMLHNQIEDALQQKGIIPNKEDKYGNKVQPGPWLEQNGWVKIHEDNIQFAGCLNDRLEKPIVDLTQKQIEIICQYAINCHKGMLKVGWKLIRCTVTMFAMQSKNLKLLYETYFNF